MEFSLEVDQEFLNESLPLMQDYLLSKETYWPINSAISRLTIGNVLFSVKRLKTLKPEIGLDFEQKAEAVKRKWKVAWEHKAAAEAESRLRLWRQYLTEQKFAPKTGLPAYATEARGRAILQLLMSEIPAHATWAELSELDTLLKMNVKPGAFVWDEMYQSVFLPADFWFLYLK